MLHDPLPLAEHRSSVFVPVPLQIGLTPRVIAPGELGVAPFPEDTPPPEESVAAGTMLFLPGNKPCGEPMLGPPSDALPQKLLLSRTPDVLFPPGIPRHREKTEPPAATAAFKGQKYSLLVSGFIEEFVKSFENQDLSPAGEDPFGDLMRREKEADRGGSRGGGEYAYSICTQYTRRSRRYP